MGIINRFLLFIYALVVLLVAVFVILFAVKALPENVLFNEASFLLKQHETLTALGIIACFSVYFLLYAYFVGEKKKETPNKDAGVVIKTATGEVSVAKNAIESLADREATSIGGVRESNAKVVVTESEGKTKLSLNISLILLAGANVPTVSAEVTRAVKERIAASLGENDVPVNLSVRELNSAPDENQRRVH